MAVWAVRQRRLLLIIAAVAVLLCFPQTLPAYADTADLKWTAKIQDSPIDPPDGNRKVALGNTDIMQVTLTMENTGATEIQVRSVRLSGRVFGLKFFSFSSLVDIVLPPGTSMTRIVEFDGSELRAEARGWIPGTLTLVGPDRKAIDDRGVPVDVRGSLFSVYSIFGLAVAGITALLFVSMLLAITRRQLPVNRWRRALGFFSIGVGLALTATFTLSSTRLLMPNPASWVTLLVVLGGTSFLLGYFLPLGRFVDASETSRANARLVSSGS